MKIRPVGAELFSAEGHAARQADIYKEAVTSQNSVHVPNNCRMRNISTAWVE